MRREVIHTLLAVGAWGTYLLYTWVRTPPLLRQQPLNQVTLLRLMIIITEHNPITHINQLHSHRSASSGSIYHLSAQLESLLERPAEQHATWQILFGASEEWQATV